MTFFAHRLLRRGVSLMQPMKLWMKIQIFSVQSCWKMWSYLDAIIWALDPTPEKNILQHFKLLQCPSFLISEDRCALTPLCREGVCFQRALLVAATTLGMGITLISFQCYSVAVLRALYLMCKWPEIQFFFFRLGRRFRCLVMCEGRGW